MLLSVVIPVFNEEATIALLLAKLIPVVESIPAPYEIIFVNDGSRDRTLESLTYESERNPALKVISFGRNFGHQAAITAGLDFAGGDAVVVMDADLQDPPEILSAMFDKFREGYDVVSAQRTARHKDTWFKRTTANAFYSLMRRMVDQRLVPNVGDFRLFSREALAGIRGFREQHRFMRGLVAWLGLKEAIVPFERQERVAGETKYPLWKMLYFAWTAISSFSALPLRFMIGVGFFFAAVGLSYFVYAVFMYVSGSYLVPGWLSVIALQCLFSGATFLALGLMGDYVARIYEEAKHRPLYVVTRTVNLPLDLHAPRAIVVANRHHSAMPAGSQPWTNSK